MKTGVMPVGQLSADQVRSVLLAATTPPPVGGGTPWRFHCTPEAITLYADPPPLARDNGPENRAQFLACGAALLNLRLAIRALGIYPETRLLPAPDRPDLLAVVLPYGREPATPVDRLLAESIGIRGGHQRPFTAATVVASTQRELRRAAEIERAWLAAISPAQLPRLREILHRAQKGSGRDDGMADFGTEPDRLLAVVGSLHDAPLSRVQAGQALQRVLLTAAAAGLSAAFPGEILAAPTSRRELRHLLGGGLWPQAMVRLGHGAPVPVAARASLADVVTSDERPFPVSSADGALRRGPR
ncbi:hypothetical protein [Amycolatopsis minnesotensis]|uniref:Nitroreductase n=1 Tax=Amycolatopsis minnesotensis TaxID=337894 RepID=A0ABP5CNJ9_9PSEU